MIRIGASLFLWLFLTASAFGMDFEWGPIDETKRHLKNPSNPILYMTGEIKAGDADRFRTFMSKNFDRYLNSARSVYLSSNGGDIVEALSIARLVRAMYVSVTVPGERSCASACFLIYISAVDRSQYSKVGVHRAYFDKQYFAGLSPTLAEKRQKELTKLLNDFLEANSVPRSIIETMNRTSSVNIHWLTDNELKQIGQYPAWYEELLLAKCKHAPSLLEEVDLLLRHEAAYTAYLNCKENVIKPELRTHLRTLLNSTK